jgi:hypothetical protein
MRFILSAKTAVEAAALLIVQVLMVVKKLQLQPERAPDETLSVMIRNNFVDSETHEPA